MCKRSLFLNLKSKLNLKVSSTYDLEFLKKDGRRGGGTFLQISNFISIYIVYFCDKNVDSLCKNNLNLANWRVLPFWVLMVAKQGA